MCKTKIDPSTYRDLPVSFSTAAMFWLYVANIWPHSLACTLRALLLRCTVLSYNIYFFIKFVSPSGGWQFCCTFASNLFRYLRAKSYQNKTQFNKVIEKVKGFLVCLIVQMEAWTVDYENMKLWIEQIVQIVTDRNSASVVNKLNKMTVLDQQQISASFVILLSLPSKLSKCNSGIVFCVSCQKYSSLYNF